MGNWVVYVGNEWVLVLDQWCKIQFISGTFEHPMLCVWEIYALETVVFHIAVYGPYKP